MTANNLYEMKFTVDLEDALFSGSVKTNADLTVKENNVEVNSIPAGNSPILGCGLSIRVKEKSNADTDGDAINGAVFELQDDNGEVIWADTSTDSGALTIPYGTGDNQCTFPAGSTYVLLQKSTDDGHVLPGGSWTLNVGNDYRITSSKNDSAAQKNRTLDTAIKKGKLVVYNDIEPTVTYDLNGGNVSGNTQSITDTIQFGNTETSHVYTIRSASDISSPATNKFFVGWNTEIDGTGTGYNPGNTITACRTENDNFTTLYAQWREYKTLTVKNETIGDYSNPDDRFPVTVTLEPAEEDDPLTSSDARLASATINGEPITWDIDVDHNKASTTFEVDGTNANKTKVLDMIPSGWKFTVQETDSKGYELKYRIGSGAYAASEPGVSENLNDDTTVYIQNNRGTVVPSGLCLSDAGMLMLIAVLASVLAIASKIAFAARRRRQMFG